MAAAPLGRNYTRLFTASAMSNLGDGVFQVALPLLALRITRSPGAVAGVSLAARLPWLLFALQAGALADRLDRLRTMVRVDLARAVLIGGLAVVVALEHESLAVLYVVAFALGIGETLFDTAAQSIMPMVVDRGQLDRANGRLYGMEMVMNQFVGPPLGGILAGAALVLAFSGSAVAYLLAFGALLTIKGKFTPSREGEVPARLRTDIGEGLRYLLRHDLLRTMAIMVGVMNLCTAAVFGILPLYAVEPGPMGLSEGGYGIFLTSLALGSVIGSWSAGWMVEKIGRSRVLFISVLTTAGMLAAPLATEPWAVGGLLVLTGVGFMGWNVVTVSLRQRIVPERLLGRLNASYRLLAWGTMPIGAGLGGVLAEAFGLRSVFAVTGVLALTLVVFMPKLTNAKLDAAEAAAEPHASSPEPADEPEVVTP